MIGYEIIVSTGIIVSFILVWTQRIYIQLLDNEHEEVLKILDKHHDSIKNKVMESQLNKELKPEQFIDELINLWDFQNIRYSFEREIQEAKSLFQLKMFPEGLMAIVISIIYVSIVNNIIIITVEILDFLIIIDSVIIIVLILQSYSYRDLIKKISKLKKGDKITEIYSIKDVFR